jgi:hypothetical protein
MGLNHEIQIRTEVGLIVASPYIVKQVAWTTTVDSPRMAPRDAGTTYEL